MIKKILYVFICVLLLIVGYSYTSYYSYLNRINKRIKSIEKKLNSKEIEELKKSVIQQKNINISISKSNRSAYHLLRIQAMMAVYNDFFYESRIKLYPRLWRFDRLFWAYISYLYFDDNDILKIYLFYDLTVKL